MATFLFWNLLKKPLHTCVARLAALHQVDVVVLAECEAEPSDVIAALNERNVGNYCFPPTESDRIRIFTRYSASSITELFNSPHDRLTTRRLRLPSGVELLICAIHFQSRLNWSREDQTLEATVIAREIERQEDELGHRRTLLVGDMNMNPFDPAMTDAQAFNAVMTRQLASVIDRTVAGRSYRCFYNPMWSYFGDLSEGPPGTYFHSGSQPSNHYWNMYDQVLLRPQVMNALAGIRVLETDGRQPLVTRTGRPRKNTASDHLPLLFSLNL